MKKAQWIVLRVLAKLDRATAREILNHPAFRAGLAVEGIPLEEITVHAIAAWLSTFHNSWCMKIGKYPEAISSGGAHHNNMYQFIGDPQILEEWARARCSRHGAK